MPHTRFCFISRFLIVSSRAEKLDPMTLLRLILGTGSYCSRPIVYKRDPTEKGGDVRGGMSRNPSMYMSVGVMKDYKL